MTLRMRRPPEFRAQIRFTNPEIAPMSLELSPIETRVLGSLLEKERTTPEYYPLSLNSLTVACNQTTNRDPIVSYDDRTVEQGLNRLREKKLAMLVHTAGARVPKYRHTLLDTYNLDAREVALMCVLMLRGSQTPGELRSRTERLCGPMTLPETEKCLEELTRGGGPLVRVIPARPGQKEKRYIQLLSGEPELEASPAPPAPPAESVSENSRIDALETQLNTLKSEFRALREELAEFKKLFG
jgi:uncharacterized protein YceH (UPF0502 family)